MTRILLIRHGHTELLGKVLYGRMGGVHLSEQGRQEIQRLAAALQQRYSLDEIVSSPMDRARETAEAIATLQASEVVFDADLQELDFGAWMGRSFEELGNDQGWKEYNRSPLADGTARRRVHAAGPASGMACLGTCNRAA